jgi:hypothetical protein
MPRVISACKIMCYELIDCGGIQGEDKGLFSLPQHPE